MIQPYQDTPRFCFQFQKELTQEFVVIHRHNPIGPNCLIDELQIGY